MTELSENAHEICKSRYFQGEESWEDLCRRVGKAISINEKDKKWEEIFAEEIYNMNFIPGGRTLRNSGKLKQSILNCAVLPISDSIEAIGETIKNALILWSYGAGIGIDFSPLRGRGSPLVSKGGESSGMVSFLEAIDSVARTIETGGQRRSGCLAMCKVNHPEIFEFINAKLVDKKLSYFNLSVAVDANFLNAVEENREWNLTFAGQKVRTIDAVELWDKILESTIKSGDPGILNYTNLRKNNSFYFQNIETTNLCGEIPLAAYGMCCLGSLVLPSFLAGKTTNWKKLSNTINIAIRFLDNVLDVNFYPIKQTEQITRDSRRLGLGSMGLHNFLMHKQIRYGSKKSILEIERLYRFIRDEAYLASIELAKEKGAFPKYSKSEHSKASFIKKLPASIRTDIKNYSIRNTTLISSQPTGCLVDGALISSSKGIKKIEDHVGIDKRNNTRNRTKSDFGTVSIKNYHDQGIADTKKITTRHGFEIEGTLNHKLRTLTSGNGYEWKELKDIVNGDIVVLKKGFILSKVQTWLSNSKAEVLGCYMADGWWTVSGRSHRLYFECANDKEAKYIIGLLHRAFDSTVPYKFKIYKRDRDNSKSVRLEINSIFLFKWFKKHNSIKKGAINSFIPDIVLKGSTENILFFIRGYHIGDGHITTRDSKIVFTSISKLLINQLQTTLLGFGILSYLNTEKDIEYESLVNGRIIKSRHDIFRLEVKKYDSYLLNNMLNLGYTLQEPVLGDRSLIVLTPDEIEKFNRFNRYVLTNTKLLPKISSNKNIICITKRRYERNIHTANYNWFIKNDLWFDVVAGTEECKSKHVNDLEIFDNSHTYIANGFITHNTTSLLADVSSGIEPVFSLAYKRKDRVSERYYIHPKFYEFLESGKKKKPEWLVDTSDLVPEEHLDVQVAIQKFTDNATSKTINCPKGTTSKELSKLLLEYAYDLKGITVYVDGSKEGQVLNKISVSESKEYIKNKKVTQSMAEGDVVCTTGMCEV